MLEQWIVLKLRKKYLQVCLLHCWRPGKQHKMKVENLLLECNTLHVLAIKYPVGYAFMKFKKYIHNLHIYNACIVYQNTCT